MMARLAAAVHFCRTRVDETDHAHVMRTRRRGSEIAISFGNALLKWEQNPVRFLHEREWLAHEVAMYRATGVAVPAARDKTIRLPMFPGRTLADHLRHSAASTRAVAFQLCVDRLQRLHAQGHSHGDAHAGNVLIDVESGTAQWIDFETCHVSSAAPSLRCADDLRALIMSTLALTENQLNAEMIKALGGLKPAVIELLCPMIRDRSRSLLQRAQGDPNPSIRHRFTDLLAAICLDAA